MNLLVTGASGFIGRRLIEAVAKNVNYSESKTILLTSKEVEGYTCIIHDNYKFEKEDFYKKGIDTIDVLIHLGAFTPKSSLDANNVEKSISNIKNTEYLLEHLPSIPKKIIFLSTIDVYNTESNMISEKTPTIPSTLYGHSKLFLEKIIVEWCNKNDVIPQVLRIGHIYGEGEDDYKKMIPTTIKKIIKNEAPVIYTDGKEKRTFLYVEDCCNAILESINLDEYKNPINIVGSECISILELVNLIIEISGKEIIPIVENRDVETRDFMFNNCKMTKYLKIEATALNEGIKREYEYFKKQYNEKGTYKDKNINEQKDVEQIE